MRVARIGETVERESRHLKSVPSSQFQYVDVTFTTADVDVVIPHELKPLDPEQINYQVVKADRATSVYNDQSVGRKPWGAGYIAVRSSVADAKVRLLLTVEQEG